MDSLEIFILRKLYSHSIFGGSYKPKEWLMGGLPPQERDMTKINKALKRLHNEGYLIKGKKGDTWSLNSAMKKEIENIVY